MFYACGSGDVMYWAGQISIKRCVCGQKKCMPAQARFDYSSMSTFFQFLLSLLESTVIQHRGQPVL